MPLKSVSWLMSLLSASFLNYLVGAEGKKVRVQLLKGGHQLVHILSSSFGALRNLVQHCETTAELNIGSRP